MGNPFKINGKQVSEAEFRVVEEALTGACGTPAFADGNLTKKEAVALLTKGQKSVSASTFLQVCKSYKMGYTGYTPISILSDYGISVAKLTNRTELAKAVQQDGAVLPYATLRDRRDPELAVMALHSGAEFAYPFLSESMRKDPFIALEAIKSDRASAWQLPMSLVSNLNFMRAAVAIDPRQFSRAPAVMHQDRSTVLSVVSRMGEMLRYASPQYWADRAVVKTALQHLERYQFSEIADLLPREFYSDPELMLEAALNAPKETLKRMKAVNSPLLKDEAFIATLRQQWRYLSYNLDLTAALYGLSDDHALAAESEALRHDPNYFETQPTEGKDGHSFTPDVVVQYLGQWLDVYGHSHHPSGMFDNYANFRKGITAITKFPERFGTTEQMLAIWYNRETIDSNEDRRPIALALYNTTDWNDAFGNTRLVYSLMSSKRFRVIYEEVSSDVEAEAMIKRVSRDGTRPIHTLVLAGHGSKTSLLLGKPAHKWRPEETTIDTQDFQKTFWKSLGHYLHADGNVMLYACSNGEGSAGANNLANAVAAVVSETVSVYSSKLPSNIIDIEVTKDLKLEVKWCGDSPYNPHRIAGK